MQQPTPQRAGETLCICFPFLLRCSEIWCNPKPTISTPETNPENHLNPHQAAQRAWPWHHVQKHLAVSPGRRQLWAGPARGGGRTWGGENPNPKLIRTAFHGRGNHADSHKLGIWLWVLISVPQLAFLVPKDKSQQAANAINKLSPRLKRSSIPLALFIPFRQTCMHTNNNKKASP